MCVRESETESGSERGSESVRESEREWERVREREREREGERDGERDGRERETDKDTDKDPRTRERGKESGRRQRGTDGSSTSEGTRPFGGLIKPACIHVCIHGYFAYMQTSTINCVGAYRKSVCACRTQNACISTARIDAAFAKPRRFCHGRLWPELRAIEPKRVFVHIVSLKPDQSLHHASKLSQGAAGPARTVAALARRTLL